MPLSNIVAVGVDHKRIRPLRRGSAETEILLKLFGSDWVATKRVSQLDGCVEATNVSYITKTGEKRAFTEFSEKVNSDPICEGFAEVIGSIIGVKPCIAEETKGLVVNKIGNSYRFNTVSVKATVLSVFVDAFKGIALVLVIGAAVVAIVALSVL